MTTTIHNHSAGVRALPVQVDGESQVVNLHPGANHLDDDLAEAILRHPLYQPLFERPGRVLEVIGEDEEEEGEGGAGEGDGDETGSSEGGTGEGATGEGGEGEGGETSHVDPAPVPLPEMRRVETTESAEELEPIQTDPAPGELPELGEDEED